MWKNTKAMNHIKNSDTEKPNKMTNEKIANKMQYKVYIEINIYRFKK